MRAIAVVVSLMMVASSACFAQTTRPTTRPSTRLAQSRPTTQPFEYVIDSSEVPDMDEWAQSLRPIVEKWYPIIVQTIPSEGYIAPRKVTIVIRNTTQIAYASGTRIVCGADWFRKRPEDRGAVVHELVHVAQQYRSRRNPGWLVEGVADYIRWYKYEPLENRRRPRTEEKYTQGYHVVGRFLDWAAMHKDHEIVVKLNAAMREGRYSPELWQEYTGKTFDELWEEHRAILFPGEAARPKEEGRSREIIRPLEEARPKDEAK
jgi:hypothetical protein